MRVKENRKIGVNFLKANPLSYIYNKVLIYILIKLSNKVIFYFFSFSFFLSYFLSNKVIFF